MNDRKHNNLINSILTVVIFLGFSPVFAQTAPPDLILSNGKIITVDNQFSIVEALAIKDDRFVAVGSDTKILAMANDTTRVIDLKGATVIPGLIDNHNHVVRATEYWNNEARLDGVETRAKALDIIREKAKTLESGEWLYTHGGWYEAQFAGDRSALTLAELDKAVPNNPAFIQASYSHIYVNSEWLKEMDFPVKAPRNYKPDAGSLNAAVARDNNGKATGLLSGGISMVGKAIARFPSVSESVQRGNIHSMMQDLNSVGLTTAYDAGGVGFQDISYDRVRELARNGETTMRIFHTLWGGSSSTPEGAQAVIDKMNANKAFQGDEWFDLIAMGEWYYPKFHQDGISRQVHPTASEIDDARRILEAAAKGGWSVQTHAVHSDNIARLLNIMDDINKDYPLRHLRWSVTHADMIAIEEVNHARALGVNLQLRSHHLIGDVVSDFEEYGDEVYNMPALRMVQDSGIIFGLGTDGTKAGQNNPFVTLWWAVTGRMLNGERIIKQTLTREEALIAHTRSNAYMVFKEADLGAIKPGYLADLVVLDRDYLTVNENLIREIKPTATIVGGKVVFGEL
jgi:predicted amidohydrolase YtcJ